MNSFDIKVPQYSLEQKTKIEYSHDESAVLGLKIGRCNASYFDEKHLYKQITANAYDICRLKVSAEDEFASTRLHKIGLPFFFSGSIRRYKTEILEKPSGEYLHSDLTWEAYDGSQNKLLKDMLKGTWGEYPIGYYRTPFTEKLINKEQEIEAVFQFYKKQNDPRVHPDNGFIFIKHGDNYVGFFAINIIDKNLESHIGGILEPYRKEGYFLDKLRYIKEFCIKNDLRHFIFGARNENWQVQRIFQHVGFKATGTENVFHIPSLLSHSAMPVVKKNIKFTEYPQRQLLDAAMVLAGRNIAGAHNISFQVNHPFLLNSGSSCTICFSFPVWTKSEKLIVMKAEERELEAFTGYLNITAIENSME